MWSFTRNLALTAVTIVSLVRNGEAGYPWPQPSRGRPSVSATWTHHAGEPSCSAITAAMPATATISAGVVIGTTTSLPSATATVNKFLGVPFAKSPPERFSPPQPAAPFGKPVEAKAWSPACIQEFVYPLAAHNFAMEVFNQPAPAESEDCLYLNVYAPSSPPPPGGRAVMFWIYGGSLQFGDAGQPVYDGSAFAAYQDVIVVSTNYRTNVFGFPNAPELPVTERNVGFLDQRFALQWVQENIHAFGGDPSKVTVFGESAGARSVDALLTTFTTETAPFRAAILESGQISYSSVPRPLGTLAWEALTALLNCTSQTSNLTCVRDVPATTIKSIIEQNSLAFNPFFDNVTWPLEPAANRAAGKFAAVPVLAGTNAQEGRVFEYGQTNLTAFLESQFASTVPSLIPTLEAAFPVGTIAGVNTPYDVISAIDTLDNFQCGKALMLNETAAQGVPTWRYYFDASFPNWSPLGGLLGIYHSSELPLVFGTYPGGPVNPVTAEPSGLIPTNVAPTAQQEALSQFFMTAWATFAKDPTHGPQWNRLGTFGGQDVGALGANGSSGVTVITEASIDALCPLFFPAFRAVTIGNAPGLA